jgi:methanogenic corrinoid protein MtbC1
MQALAASGWSPKEAAAVVSDDSDLKAERDDLERDQPPPSWHQNRSSPRASAQTVDLVAAAAALDPSAVTRLLDERFATGSFEHVVDDWLLPELDRLGMAWAEGGVTVAGEHMAAGAVQRRLSAAFDAAAVDGARSPLLLTGLPPGCRHELGILAFATAARRQGLAVVHLGSDLPLADWLTAAERHRPDGVVLAAPTPSDVAPVLEIIEGIGTGRALVAIGGRHQNEVVEATIRLGHPAALALGHSVSRAAALLRDRLGPGRT